MSQPKVDIVVLTWNKLEMTRRFMESLLKHTPIPSRVIVIDNASQDGTPEYLESLTNTESIQFEIVRNQENVGFVKGVNQALAMTEAPFVCLMNNDLIVTEGWLQGMFDLMRTNEHIGLLNPNSNNLGAKPSGNVALDDYANQIREQYQNTFLEVPFCIGFCMLIRREVLQAVGGLSEEFMPMFFEDTDFTMKARQAGFLTGIARGTYVYHEEHGSVDQLKQQESDAIMAKSRATFERKWGRILRIAQVVDPRDPLKKSLEKAIALARKGNFVWFFVKGKKEEREAFFKNQDFHEHAGVHLVFYQITLQLLWLILKKKKRYHLIYTSFPFVTLIASLFHFRVLKGVDLARIEEEKRRDVALKDASVA